MTGVESGVSKVLAGGTLGRQLPPGGMDSICHRDDGSGRWHDPPTCPPDTSLPRSQRGDAPEAFTAAQGLADRDGCLDHLVDAPGDDFGKLAFAFLAQEIAIVRGHGFKVLHVFRAERFEAREGFFEMAARP